MSDIDIDIAYESVGACLGLEGNSLLGRGRAPLIFQGVIYFCFRRFRFKECQHFTGGLLNILQLRICHFII